MGFLDSIVNFFGGITSVLADILAVAEWLFNIILYVAQVLLDFIVAVANFFLSVIAQIGKFLVNLWQNFIKGIFTRVLSVLQKAHDWLEAHLRPLINFLKKIRALQDAYFNRYLKPLLNLLQHVRQFLQLLRLLHINVAVQLDNYIAQLESKLATTFLTLRAAVNNAIDLLNIVADPTLLIRKPTLLLSVRRQLPALIRALTGRPPGYFFPSPKGTKGGLFSTFAPTTNAFQLGKTLPTSLYTQTDDGIGKVPVFSLANVPPDSVADDIDLLDYFNDDLYPSPVCSDPAHCLNQALQLLVPARSNG